ncbi:MAG: ATP-binding protein [Phycisphaerales bacterium JB040]
MTPRRRWVWIGYWGGVALLSLVLVGVSLQVLVFESGEALLRAQRQRQEAVRLALWRMDSWLAPLLAREARRPYFEYRAVLPVGRSYESMWAPITDGEPVAPSPLVLGRPSDPPGVLGQTPNAERGGLVRLHVQIGSDGDVTSPQVPSDADLARLVVDDPAIAISMPDRDRAGTVLGVLSGMLESSPMDDAVWARAADEFSRSFEPLADPRAPAPSRQMGALLEGQTADASTYDDPALEYGLRSNVQQLLNSPQLPTKAGRTLYDTAGEPGRRIDTARGADFAEAERELEAGAEILAQKSDQRGERLADAVTATRDQPRADGATPDAGTGASNERARESASLALPPDPAIGLEPATVEVGPMAPVWLESDRGAPELLYLRRVEVVGADARLQGVWLDWDLLRSRLLDQAGLSGQATLLPVTDPTAGDDPARRLAAVPAVLDLPDVTPPALGLTPARWSLLLTWAAVLASVAAIGVVLRTAMRLSDRRVRFVGAVTHELRTPLTTFRLYSQMLADGMVTEESSRREYLSTLKEESARLAGIVENVLAYARLNRAGRTGANARPDRIESITPDRLLARLLPSLSRRAEQSGMDLIVSNEAAGVDRALQVDPQSVERILTNLVDNACKYAPPASEGQDDPPGETRIHLDVRLVDDTLEVLVADYGPGIDPADRARVFGEFQRGRAGQRADRSGLGLGLALSRGLARESGGDLRLTRRRGHGAEFLLTLPLQPVSAGS